MHLLFVDESGTPPPPGIRGAKAVFVLGGVVIPEDVWPKLRTDLAVVKSDFGVTGEVKWRYFAQKASLGKTHSLSHLSNESRDALRSQLYRVLCQYESVRLICAVTEGSRAYGTNQVQTPDELYWCLFKQMTERFQDHLQDLERTAGTRFNGLIVADHRGAGDDNRLKDLHHRLIQDEGASPSNHRNLVEGLFIAPSHQSVGIQFADLVAGAVYRKYAHGDERFFSMIEANLRRAESGLVDDYGLISWPK